MARAFLSFPAFEPDEHRVLDTLSAKALREANGDIEKASAFMTKALCEHQQTVLRRLAKTIVVECENARIWYAIDTAKEAAKVTGAPEPDLSDAESKILLPPRRPQEEYRPLSPITCQIGSQAANPPRADALLIPVPNHK
jgi:hypothetical protein